MVLTSDSLSIFNSLQNLVNLTSQIILVLTRSDFGIIYNVNYVFVVCDKISFFLLKFITNYSYIFKEIEEKQNNIFFC